MGVNFCSVLVTKVLRANLRLWNLTATKPSINMLIFSSLELTFSCCSSDHLDSTDIFFYKSLIFEMAKSLFCCAKGAVLLKVGLLLVFYLRTRRSSSYLISWSLASICCLLWSNKLSSSFIFLEFCIKTEFIWSFIWANFSLKKRTISWEFCPPLPWLWPFSVCLLSRFKPLLWCLYIGELGAVCTI